MLLVTCRVEPATDSANVERDLAPVPLLLGYFVRKQNHASAGRKHRNAAGNSRLQVVEHAKFAKQFALHGRFAARKHDTIELLVQVARLAELDALCAKLFKLMFMFNEGALDGQNANKRFSHIRNSICESPMELYGRRCLSSHEQHVGAVPANRRGLPSNPMGDSRISPFHVSMDSYSENGQRAFVLGSRRGPIVALDNLPKESEIKEAP